MNFVISGGTGFIGRYLVNRLASDPDNSVVILDKFIPAGFDDKNCEIIECELVSDKIPDIDCDVFIHAAAVLGVDYVETHPQKTLIDNVAMFRQLFDFVNKANCKFVFLSTSEVYGDGRGDDNRTTDEIKLPDLSKPRSSYAFSKIIGEFFVNLGSDNNLIVRPHNIYGPLMGTRHVIPHLMNKVIAAGNDGIVELYNPTHVRSFCYIQDAVDQIVFLIGSDCKGVFNIGNPKEPISMLCLGQMIAGTLGVNCRFKEVEGHGASPSFRRPELDGRLRQNFVTLEDGLKTMTER